MRKKTLLVIGIGLLAFGILVIMVEPIGPFDRSSWMLTGISTGILGIIIVVASLGTMLAETVEAKTNNM